MSLGVPFLVICKAILIYLVLFSGLFYSVLGNLQGVFDIYIFLFFRVCSKAFLSLVILLISAFLRAHFSEFSRGFFVGLILQRFSAFWFCSFQYSVYRAALSSENACY